MRNNLFSLEEETMDPSAMFHLEYVQKTLADERKKACDHCLLEGFYFERLSYSHKEKLLY